MDTESLGAAQNRAGSGNFLGRISPIMALFFIMVALLIDGVQAFLNLIIIGIVLNWIVDIFTWLLFYIWLKMLGISMSEAKGMRTMIFLGLACGFEFIPLVNALPGWTAFAIGAVVNEYGTTSLSKVPLAGKFLKKSGTKSEDQKWVATKVGSTYKFLNAEE
ncbi:MAG: hypothetical protein UW28_C0017G0002 [Parcubacteria group bacterium GW2011_GWA2_44_13]|nr:MAG: hypothetical protein UW28_C0017G0002 [Parcubacteria group bacterium GW2011_GWA2_44_13]